MTRSRHRTAGHWVTAGAAGGFDPSSEQAGKVNRQRHVSKLRSSRDCGAGLLAVGLLLPVDSGEGSLGRDLLGRPILGVVGAKLGSLAGCALVVGVRDGDTCGKADDPDSDG